MDKLIKKMSEYLCPPGNGVFTVHTAKEHKRDLHNHLYGESNSEKVQKKWKQSLEKLEESNTPCLLGITSDTGGGIQRGANWGPLFIRNQLLNLTDSFFDLGDIRVIPHLLHDKYLNQETLSHCKKALYSDEDSALPVSPLSIVEDFCQNFHKVFPKKNLFSLGGDHSVSYPLIEAWLQAKKEQGTKTAIIHFDAHTDLMDRRLGIDICFGSWAYHMIPLLDSPDLLLQYGIRSSGQTKEHWEGTLGVKQFWNFDFKSLGEKEILAQSIRHLKAKRVKELYISFDIDALDSKYASATGTPETDGLERNQCIFIIEELAKHFTISGADLVEVAPFVKNTNSTQLEPDSTLLSAKIISETILKVL